MAFSFHEFYQLPPFGMRMSLPVQRSCGLSQTTVMMGDKQDNFDLRLRLLARQQGLKLSTLSRNGMEVMVEAV
jgi:hypothetical protein